MYIKKLNSSCLSRSVLLVLTEFQYTKLNLMSKLDDTLNFGVIVWIFAIHYQCLKVSICQGRNQDDSQSNILHVGIC